MSSNQKRRSKADGMKVRFPTVATRGFLFSALSASCQEEKYIRSGSRRKICQQRIKESLWDQGRPRAKCIIKWQLLPGDGFCQQVVHVMLLLGQSPAKLKLGHSRTSSFEKRLFRNFCKKFKPTDWGVLTFHVSLSFMAHADYSTEVTLLPIIFYFFFLFVYLFLCYFIFF